MFDYIVPAIVWNKISFALYVFNNNSSFLNSLIFLKNWKFYQKRAFNQRRSLSNVPFWPAPNMPKRIYWKLLNLARFIIVLKKLEGLWSHIKKLFWSLKKTGTSYRKKVVYTGNPEKNYCSKVKKSSKKGNDKKSFISFSL